MLILQKNGRIASKLLVYESAGFLASDEHEESFCEEGLRAWRQYIGCGEYTCTDCLAQTGKLSDSKLSVIQQQT